ncbi:AbrB/MazE/SpoVT family DNA-binding domain-containing protein [Synechococcus moorigangaii CMS01]|nr:AbrB/MazE/SpoVT family DNA-binding domain-containing protein [Synechococcus moorigangaii CMS01]
MITQKITKWGNSFGIRLPQSMLQQCGWQEGEQVTISMENNQIILSLARPKYSLAELLKEAKPEAQHSEVDWGEVEGEESW